jgi:23S rRNA pseudouridine1911/1915/1917 synthase
MFPRQALHARRLGLVHPVSGRPMSWQAPLPADMQDLIAKLEAAE